MATSTTTSRVNTADLLLDGDPGLLLMEGLRVGVGTDDIGTHQAMPGGTARGAQPITSSFNGGTLSVTGGKQGNAIEISRNAAGAILVNDGAVSTTGGTPTIVNTSLIQVSGNAR